MTDFKGTPGPWSTSKHYEDCLIVLDPRGYEIVSAETLPILSNYSERLGVQHWSDDERAAIELSQDEQAANAMLIAAAPELLEVLQEMVAIVKKNSYPCPDKPNSNYARAEEAEAVIAKALGK
ncbi:hypothetical protein ACLEXX_02185 [Enterobacter ludwigii]|uniref:hypothetical protein n=1 Tax=Enterobacter ludwigii TaxID=299767 RepID=UPI003974D9C5